MDRADGDRKMVTEKYLANEAAFGRGSFEKFNAQTVGVTGDGQIAQAVIYNLIGLGIGSIEHVCTSAGARNVSNFSGEKTSSGVLRDLAKHIVPGVQSLSDALFFIAPSMNYKLTSSPSAESTIVDTTKYICSDIAQRKKEYQAIESLIAGSLFADEVRKSIVTLSAYEQSSPNMIVDAISLPKIFDSRAAYLEPSRMDRALVIGAGGLGTYFTYILAQRGTREIVICDPDVIEEKNLNRQLFYTGRVGELKAQVLAERLSDSNSNVEIIPRTNHFDENFYSKRPFDVIFCCTDTLESRIAASNYAYDHQIPLIEGACTPTMGSITTYVPGKTKTIADQRNLKELVELQNVEKKKVVLGENVTSCARVINPSVIGPNVIIGCLQALALDTKYDSCGDAINSYPQVFLNLLRSKKFSNGGA